MSLEVKSILTRALGYVPPAVKEKLQLLRDRFMAADKRTRYAISAAAVAVLVSAVVIGGGGNDNTGAVTFTARRGNLDITVLEGGALEALQSQEVRSGVRGRDGTKILSIVEEGYRVTPEDVTAGKVLVELDTSSLIEQQLNQEISVETAEASYIERKAQYEIQLNKNITDLNDARQSMKFARLDFEKFLGANLVGQILDDLGIEARLARAEAADLAAVSAIEQQTDSRLLEQIADSRVGTSTVVPATGGIPAFDPADIDSMPPQLQERMRQLMAENNGEIPAEMLQRFGQRPQGGGGFGNGRQGGTQIPVVPVEIGTPSEEPVVLELEPLVPESTVPVLVQSLMDDEYMRIRSRIDFRRYTDLEALEDGEAKQRLRSLQDDVQESEEEFLIARDRVEGQRRLEDRGFITPTELEAEELKVNKAVNRQEETQTALKLYKQYTFLKDAEKLLADYENAVMALQRTLKENIAEEAQEEARLKSAEKKYNLEVEKLADINEQIDLATIRATRPGLVVYGGSDQNPMRYRGGGNQEAIQEGATVIERQPILTIPDLREMAVKVNIHESSVKRLGAGQTARIKIDAFPNERLTGAVTRVAVVADSASSFMNPDLKVYPTVVKIEGTYEWLRPGMSAEVEILVDTLEDVVYVPLQAVSYVGDQ
ncbi:MAG: HlyD family efflux transporter periplasmic adaptor subunit, partial [Pseudohongiellaceae bacterium]